MLKVANLEKIYHQPGHQAPRQALAGVSLEIQRAESFGLVGASGAGKTSLAKCIIGLERPSAGAIYFHGQEISRLHPRERLELWSKIQIVWQDPQVTLNPYRQIASILQEPLDNYRRGDRAARQKKVSQLLDLVGLSASVASAYPHELSGGQCQRVAIARALALEPELLICDEPLANLDTARQVKIIQLLQLLQKNSGISYLFISHDLGVVRALCSRMAVLYKGHLVESGNTAEIFRHPQHPYTQALIAQRLRLQKSRPERA